MFTEFSRPKIRVCRVCSRACVGHVCRTCYNRKNNKIAGKYSSHNKNCAYDDLASIISNTNGTNNISTSNGLMVS